MNTRKLMRKPRKLTRRDIVPDELLPFTRRFLHQFVDQVISYSTLFSTENDRKLVRDWNYMSWLEYYDHPPTVLEQLGEILTGPDKDKTSEDPVQRSRDFLKYLRQAEVETTKVVDENAKERTLNELILPRLLPIKFQLLVLANHSACFAKYHATIADLKAAIREGDDGAIFDLLTVDHIFLELPEVRNRIREATLFNDEDFLYNLGVAIDRPCIRTELSAHKDDLLIAIAWGFGFEHVGLEEFSTFLQEIGIKRYSETSTLSRKLNRLGISQRKIKSDTK
jgi:hypothetical protein